jgi:hypothetical protein
MAEFPKHSDHSSKAIESMERQSRGNVIVINLEEFKNPVPKHEGAKRLEMLSDQLDIVVHLI